MMDEQFIAYAVEHGIDYSSAVHLLSSVTNCNRGKYTQTFRALMRKYLEDEN